MNTPLIAREKVEEQESRRYMNEHWNYITKPNLILKSNNILRLMSAKRNSTFKSGKNQAISKK
jgi:hypothetical protein